MCFLDFGSWEDLTGSLNVSWDFVFYKNMPKKVNDSGRVNIPISGKKIRVSFAIHKTFLGLLVRVL